jgi:hypothetical protein
MLLMLVAVTVAAGAACTPIKRPTPGRSIGTYYAVDNTVPGFNPATFPANVFRSFSPTMRTSSNGAGTMSQRLDGNAVILQVVNGVGQAGFGILPVRLGDIQSIRIRVEVGGDAVQFFMILDKDNDGQFLTYDANGKATGLGGDEIAFDGLTFSELFINDNRNFTLESNNAVRQLFALKQGVEPGISADTRVIVGVLTGFPDSLIAVSSFQLNDVELL